MEEQRYVILITPEGTMYPRALLAGEDAGAEDPAGAGGRVHRDGAGGAGVEWDREADGMPLLLVNEEGKLRGLPRNGLATEMTMLPRDHIVGNAVLMAGKLDELVGLTRERAEKVMAGWAE